MLDILHFVRLDLHVRSLRCAAVCVCLAINRSMFCFCLDSHQPFDLLSCLSDAVVHATAVKTPQNHRVCFMYVHDDAKMQKHSSQPHNDATDGKKKNVICLVYNREINSMSTRRQSRKNIFIYSANFIDHQDVNLHSDWWMVTSIKCPPSPGLLDLWYLKQSHPPSLKKKLKYQIKNKIDCQGRQRYCPFRRNNFGGDSVTFPKTNNRTCPLPFRKTPTAKAHPLSTIPERQIATRKLIYSEETNGKFCGARFLKDCNQQDLKETDWVISYSSPEGGGNAPESLFGNCQEKRKHTWARDDRHLCYLHGRNLEPWGKHIYWALTLILAL